MNHEAILRVEVDYRPPRVLDEADADRVTPQVRRGQVGTHRLPQAAEPAASRRAPSHVASDPQLPQPAHSPVGELDLISDPIPSYR
jgi:hypothetical protein